MANTTIVTTEAEAVNLLDTTRAAYDAAVAARMTAFAATQQADATAVEFQAFRTALVEQERARAAWLAASTALEALWRAQDADEEVRLQAMCDAHDALDWDYDGFDDHAYHLTPAGEQYLDRHYATHSNAGMLAAGGESPYSDGTTGWAQPTPAHPCYRNGVCDMDALTRYEDLSY